MSEEKEMEIKELEEISGSDGDVNGAYCYCPNPECWNHKQKYNAYPENCLSCDAKMVWVNY